MHWRKVLKLVRWAGSGMARSGNRSLGGKPDGEIGSTQSPNNPPKRPGIWLGGPTESLLSVTSCLRQLALLPSP